MRIPFRPSTDVDTAAPLDPVIANRIAQWRVVMFWTRVICWVLIAFEYVGPLTDKLQIDEAAVLGAAVVALFGGRRRWPLLVTVEFFACAYLVLEESNHYTPVALCLLVAGHAAFTTKIPFVVLFGIGIAGLSLGYMDGTYPDGALIRLTLVVGVALWGGRLFRLWVEELVADIGKGFNDLFDRGFSVYPAFLDFAATTTGTLDSMIDNDPVVDRLRERIIELETANAAASAALSIADHDDDFEEEDCASRPITIAGVDMPSMSTVRPHFLTRAADGGQGS